MGKRLHDFVCSTRFADLPDEVVRMARRCLLDLIGTAAAGTQTDMSRIIIGHAARFFGAGQGERPSRILFDGRSASPVGAALAGGVTIDSFDCHDGHVLTKGHAGCAILPGLAAVADTLQEPMRGDEFLASLVIGYEIALRAGIAQHRICCDYHTSGAWNALGVAAAAARVWGFDATRLREAIGIAEYHGPRSQMMRCIDFPTMVRDGSGWGAMAGLSAAHLAADGFTGAPALVVEDEKVADLWSDLGERWRILEQYFKPYPVCRWAQPAIEAALSVRRAHDLTADAIEQIEIETFHNAVRLDDMMPATTEIAQYNLPFPVAVAVAYGEFPPSAIVGPSLQDPTVRSLSSRIRLIEAPDLEARFPAERFARARFRLKDGRVLESETLPARGDAERPLSDAEILAKFHANADDFCGTERAGQIVDAVAALSGRVPVNPLLDLITAPPVARAFSRSAA
ncbi:MmgE/PrpD family protein [Pseudaminobacter sp. 19-2017]|uniref:MmgE/PrpD family protein n=1 Tax=Pseudaminobacter soli (ex Zhang et al. 2022) TaxID=2831468 RepID=A0A942DVF2_9HYPH|nr:MmgE/PrpD family protein [Pseudaminobacter soli]